MITKNDTLPVSVVIPTYNGEAYIEEAILSVFSQTQMPREVIVVDDASTDGTAPRVEETAAAAPVPVQLIRLSQNSGGPARPMNVGIEAAKSPFIAVLDQDDVFLPRRIASQAAILAAHPDVAFVFGYLDCKQRPGQPPLPLPEKQWGRLRSQMMTDGNLVSCDGRLALRVLLNHGNCVGGFPAFTFRRDDWLALGGLDERLAGAADLDLLCRLCLRGRVAMVSEVHYLHRLHNANLSRLSLLGLTDGIETLAKFAECRAWPTAAREVRQAIGRKLYTLAILLGVSGPKSLSRTLFAASCFVGGLHPGSLLRAANYPVKVFRRVRRSAQAPASSHELRCAVRSLDTISTLYGRSWWRPWLRSAESLQTIPSPPLGAIPPSAEERRAA